MKISLVYDARAVLEEAKMDVQRGFRDEDDPLLKALEWATDTAEGLEEDLDIAEDEYRIVSGRLENLRDAVDKALGYLTPSSSAWEVLNDAMEDTK